MGKCPECEGKGTVSHNGRWHRQGPIFLARCRGRWPTGQAFSVWSDVLWTNACERILPIPLDLLPEIGCFVAGTMIETESGPVPIENVVKGDRVMTRQGYKRVQSSFCTGVKPTMTLTTEDGRSLTGTGNHPIWDGHEWRNLDSLMSLDTVMTWKESYTTASRSAAIRNPSGIGTGDTFSLVATVSKYPFIATNGKRSTGRFPKGRLSTTRTKTPATTTSVISNASLRQNIQNTTTSLIASVIWPVRGTRVRQGGRGIRSTLEKSSLDGKMRLSATVRNVALSIHTPRLLHRDFALASASRLFAGGYGPTMWNGRASNAASYSSAVNTNQLDLVPVRVATNNPGKHEKVYNLSVEDCHEYFANGILVHNCDVARFGDDFTAFHVRWGHTSLYHEARNGWSTDQIAGHLKALAEKFADQATKKRPETAKPISWKQIAVKIDDDGVGGGTVDLYRLWGGNAIAIGAGTISLSGRYPNKRSELWFQTADRASGGMVSLGLLPKATLSRMRQQALAVQYMIDAAGRRVVEKKEETKLKIGRSPDDLDGMNLAYFEGYSFETARFIEGRPPVIDPSGVRDDWKGDRPGEIPRPKRRIW